MIEIPAPLSPLDANSFAYFTFKDRLPVILARIVDSLYRNKKVIIDELGEDKIDCLKYITAEMSRLRHELTTDKAITFFDGNIFGDEQNWNDAIIEERSRLIKSRISDNDITWFKCSFLFAECYMYRRIYDSVLKSGIPEIDQFSFEKEELLQKAMENQQFLTKYFINIWPTLPNCNKVLLLSYFEVIMKMSLWANEVDLSLSIKDEESKLNLDNPEKIIEDNNNKLLIDDYKDIFEFLFNKSTTKQEEVIVSIFVDNCGSELLADLHFVEFLLASRLANKVIIYTKSMPWYISDVTERDFQATLSSLCKSNETLCQWLGKQIYSRLVDDCNLSVRSHHFLTLSCPFHKLKILYPDFYHEISNSTLIVFKGDLNYRKLVSDLHWPIANVSFYDSLLGFNPTTIVALRVLKCNVQVALTNETLSRVEKEHPDDWMISSRYGVIQSCFVKE